MQIPINVLAGIITAMQTSFADTTHHLAERYKVTDQTGAVFNLGLGIQIASTPRIFVPSIITIPLGGMPVTDYADCVAHAADKNARNMRLKTMTAWSSRDVRGHLPEKSKKYGGAIVAQWPQEQVAELFDADYLGEVYGYMACSGMREYDDEACVLLGARRLNWVANVEGILRISGNDIAQTLLTEYPK